MKVYSEVVGEDIHKLQAYRGGMASGNPSRSVNNQEVQGVLKLWSIVKSQSRTSQEQANCIKLRALGLSVSPPVHLHESYLNPTFMVEALLPSPP